LRVYEIAAYTAREAQCSQTPRTALPRASDIADLEDTKASSPNFAGSRLRGVLVDTRTAIIAFERIAVATTSGIA
jgi:hypothetical protein